MGNTTTRADRAKTNANMKQTLLAQFAPNLATQQAQEPVLYPSGKKDQPMRAGENYYLNKEAQNLNFSNTGTEVDGKMNYVIRSNFEKKAKEAQQADADWDKYFSSLSQNAYNKRFQTKKQPEASTPVQQRNLATSLGGDTLMARYGL